jgi:hypothetical protein
MDEQQRTELEAATFRRLVAHLQGRTDVQNIDLMNLGGFCRNCMWKWMVEEAAARGQELGKEEAREEIYGMPYAEWKAHYQTPATPEQLAAFERSHKT